MPIHYAIAHPCDVKSALGGESGLAAKLRLRRTVDVIGADDAATTVRWLQHTTGMPTTLSLDDARDAVSRFGELTTACAECRANRLPATPGGGESRGVGCSGAIRLPITAAGEQYVRSLLVEGLQAGIEKRYDLRLLLIEQLRNSPTRGLASLALRRSDRGPEFYELRRAPVASAGSWFRRARLNTDQVFERSILERNLTDGVCLFLAGFSGGIRVRPVPPGSDVRAMRPAEGVPWTIEQPDDRNRPDVLWTFELPDPPAACPVDDRSVADLRRFFTACFHAYTLRLGMAMEAAVAPGMVE